MLTTLPHRLLKRLRYLVFLNRGESKGCQPQEVLEQVEVLKANIAELETQERELDMQKACLQQSIKHLNEDPTGCRYPYFNKKEMLILCLNVWVFPWMVNTPRKILLSHHCQRSAANYMVNATPGLTDNVLLLFGISVALVQFFQYVVYSTWC